jgi:ABC-type sulfate transport system permease subunit
MKTKLLMIFCVCVMAMSSVNTSRASEDPLNVVGDVVLARPGCFLATIFGSVAFVVALPFAATSGSVKATADTLIGQPARATFTRPLGDFSSLQ